MVAIGSIDGRAVIRTSKGFADVALASQGAFGPAPTAVFERWTEFYDWARAADLSKAPAWDTPQEELSDIPVGLPRQALGLSVNYKATLDYHGVKAPLTPNIFAKLTSSLTGNNSTISLVSGEVTTEVEVGVVIGKAAERVSEEKALDYVAGVAVTQDLYDYSLASAAKAAGVLAPLVNPSKSRPGFAPIGPVVVSLDELPPVDRLRLRLKINGELRQDATTAGFLFSIPEIISQLSHQIVLYPGDILLTGSPGYLDSSKSRNLRPGDTVEAEIEGVGTQKITLAGTDD
jgi:2-keto-4-pentenoate hydratase/2-oxohepta-3-ene-1,7-dioic acid hydratase in catechol pathway